MTDEEVLHSVELERSVLRKLMTGLMPFLGVLYMFNMLDRGNVSIAGLTMQNDLRYSSTVFGFGIGIFYVGYFLFEVPSNMIMERVGARPWIARIMITWGIVSSCLMFVRTPASFYALRILLGVAEAGFYPGIILYVTYWAPGRIRGQVIGRFLALTALFGLIGPPLGGLLLGMNGFHGLKGWQWLFLLEGIPSILLGFLVLKVLPNRPSETKWLTPDEKRWIEVSLAREEKNELRIHHPSLLAQLLDPRIAHLCLIFILSSIGGNMIGSVAPQLLKARSGNAMMIAPHILPAAISPQFMKPEGDAHWPDPFVATMTVIPAIVGAIAMSIAVRHSDQSGHRRMHIVIGYFIAGLGFLLCVYSPTAPLILVALSVNALGERIAAGSYWAVTTNLMGARAAAACIAFINSVGNLGGFVGPYLMGILKDQTHGGYTVGLYVATAFLVATSLVSFLLRRHPASEERPSLSTDEVAALAQPEQHIP